MFQATSSLSIVDAQVTGACPICRAVVRGSTLHCVMANQNVDDFVSACRRLCDEENYQEAAKLAILFQASQKSVPLGRMNAAFDAMVSPKFTIVMVALLACKLRSPLDKDKDWKQLGPQIQTLVAVMDTERVFLVRDQFHFIIHELTKSLLKRNVPASGIQLVLAAIQRSCPNGQVLSPIHADLCHLCLAAKNFKPVLPLLEADIRDLQVSSKGKFDATAFLLYYFYGGRIYAALKEYNKAKFFFTAAVTCPATHLSGIVVEAYKRLCFVSILATGEGPKLPAYASTAVRPLGQKDDLLFPYADICQCYKRRDLEEYDTLLAQHKSLLVTEEMKGLVKQVRKALVKQKILHVIKIFMTTTVQEVAVRVSTYSCTFHADL